MDYEKTIAYWDGVFGQMEASKSTGSLWPDGLEKALRATICG